MAIACDLDFSKYEDRVLHDRLETNNVLGDAGEYDLGLVRRSTDVKHLLYRPATLISVLGTHGGRRKLMSESSLCLPLGVIICSHHTYITHILTHRARIKTFSLD